MEKKRSDEIDVVKALAIFFMVWGHIGLPGTKYLYLFHMAVFFICSGIVYNEENALSITSVLVFMYKKIKTLYLPYVFCAIIFTLLNNFFLRIGFYDESICPHQSGIVMFKNCIRGILFSRGTQLGGATWFLRTLFFISIFYCIVNYILVKFNGKKIQCWMQFISSAILLFLLYLFGSGISNKSIYYFISSFILGFWCFSFGVILKNKRILIILKKKLVCAFLLLIVNFTVLLVLSKLGSINIDRGNFKNPIFFMAVSILGFFYVYTISIFICKTNLIKNTFVIVGQNTLAIVILHLLVFKFMNLFYIKILSLNNFMFLSSFPTLVHLLNNSNVHQIYCIGGGYLLAGIVIPVLLNEIKKKFVQVMGLIIKVIKYDFRLHGNL